jgi:hypothetical protein
MKAQSTGSNAKRRATFVVDAEIVDRIEDLSRRSGRSRSAQLEAMLRMYLQALDRPLGEPLQLDLYDLAVERLKRRVAKASRYH